MGSVFLVAHRSLKFGQPMHPVHIPTPSHMPRVSDGKIILGRYIGTRPGEKRRKERAFSTTCDVFIKL